MLAFEFWLAVSCARKFRLDRLEARTLAFVYAQLGAEFDRVIAHIPIQRAELPQPCGCCQTAPGAPQTIGDAAGRHIYRRIVDRVVGIERRVPRIAWPQILNPSSPNNAVGTAASSVRR